MSIPTEAWLRSLRDPGAVSCLPRRSCEAPAAATRYMSQLRSSCAVGKSKKHLPPLSPFLARTCRRRSTARHRHGHASAKPSTLNEATELSAHALADPCLREFAKLPSRTQRLPASCLLTFGSVVYIPYTQKQSSSKQHLHIRTTQKSGCMR